MKKRDIWISVAIIAAACLTFYFFVRQKGHIKIDTPGVQMQLRCGYFSKRTITSTDGPVTVSARVYRPEGLSIAMKENGNTWRVDSRGPWGNLSQIKVQNDETTVLELGPPLLIKPKVRQRGSLVSVDFSIVGQAGEQYGNSIMKNRRRIPAPRLKIVDEAGEVLASGKFAYG